METIDQYKARLARHNWRFYESDDMEQLRQGEAEQRKLHHDAKLHGEPGIIAYHEAMEQAKGENQ